MLVVGFGVFIAADDLTVVSTMLRDMIGDLEIPLPEGFDDAAWIVNAYLVAYVAAMPIAGRLSDLWGRRPVFVGALGLFLAGSIWIPLAPSLGPFLAGRVLTAVGGGAMVPVALAAVSDVYPEERRGRALGALGAIDTLGWVWGPLFGAILVRYLDWQWQFYLNVPLALVGIGLAWVTLGDVGERTPGRRLDLPGATTLTIALVALTIGLLQLGDIATAEDLAGFTDPAGIPVWPFFVIAAVAGAAFAWIERRSVDPLIDPGLLRRTNVAPALGANLIVGAVLVIAMVDVPLFVNIAIETDLERAAVLSGWVLTSLTALMAAAAPVGGWITDRWSYRMPTVGGLALASLAFLWMGLEWDVGITGPAMALHLGLLGLGLGLVNAPLTSAVVDATPTERRGVGAALVILARLMGLALGLAGLTAWALTRFDDLRMGLDLPPLGDPGYEDALESATADITATSLAETFLFSAAIAAIGVLVGIAIRSRRSETARDA
jgi:MFS family permease